MSLVLFVSFTQCSSTISFFKQGKIQGLLLILEQDCLFTWHRNLK